MAQYVVQSFTVDLQMYKTLEIPKRGHFYWHIM